MQLNLAQKVKINKSVVFSVTDQATYAGSNYLFNIGLFRILNIEEYGFFTYTYSIFIFFSFIFFAGVLEPLVVNGIKKGNSGKRFYNYNTIIGLIVIVLLFFVILFLLQGWLFNSIKSNTILVSLAISLGMLANFIFVTFKRIEYNENNQFESLLSSILYFLVLSSGIILGLYFKNQIGYFSLTKKIFIVYSWIAIASLMGTLYFKSRILEYVELFKKTSLRNILKIWKINFSIAGWMLLNGFFMWLTKYFFAGYLGYTKGFENTGLLRVTENLFVPIEQFISALGIVIFPIAVSAGSNSKANEYIKKTSLYLLASVAVYILIVIIFFKPISYVLYGTTEFDISLNNILYSFGFLTIARVFVDFYFGLRVRLYRQHKLFVLISILIFLITFFPGKYLLNQYGLNGVAVIYFSVGLLQILISVFLIKRLK